MADYWRCPECNDFATRENGYCMRHDPTGGYDKYSPAATLERLRDAYAQLLRQHQELLEMNLRQIGEVFTLRSEIAQLRREHKALNNKVVVDEASAVG